MSATLDLFPDLAAADEPPPAGWRYASDVIPTADQARLVSVLGARDFAPFNFRGFKGNRRTVAFGLRYDFTHSCVAPAEPLPDWLEFVRLRAAAFAAVPASELSQALVTEYAPGAGIGWHRDRPDYDRVIGLSFGTPCRLRFRRRVG